MIISEVLEEFLLDGGREKGRGLLGWGGAHSKLVAPQPRQPARMPYGTTADLLKDYMVRPYVTRNLYIYITTILTCNPSI